MLNYMESAGEHLNPIMTIARLHLHIADADSLEAGIEDIGPMAFGVHPHVHDIGRGAGASGDVLRRSAVGNVCFLERCEAVRAVWTGVGKGLNNLVCTELRYAA